VWLEGQITGEIMSKKKTKKRVVVQDLEKKHPEVVTFELKGELRDKLDADSKSKNRTRSAQIRNIISEYYDDSSINIKFDSNSRVAEELVKKASEKSLSVESYVISTLDEALGL